MPSARSQLRQWIKEQLELQDEVELPKLTSEAVALFKQNPELMQQLVEESVPAMVYELVQKTLSVTRRIQVGDTITTAEGVETRAKAHSVFLSWYEHTARGHVKLMEMTREELLEAAKEREERGQHELGLARLWRTIAEQLEGGQKVSTKFTAEDIEKLQHNVVMPQIAV